MKVVLFKILPMLFVLLVPAVAASLDLYVANACAGVAKVFFSVVPIAFVLGSAIGLVSRHRA